MKSRNVTFNMFVSLNGPEYFNLRDGATDKVEFLNFFTEESERECADRKTSSPRDIIHGYRGRGRSINGGHIFIYSCCASLISFEIDCFYSL